MGRGYIVEDIVEEYLSKLCSLQAHPVTGLLIGQSLAQRDFIVMAAQTPHNEETQPGKSVDKDWVSEHGRQVSRMLPGGLSVLGVFLISDADAKDTLPTLRQLVFALENLICSEHLWNPADDDITDCVTLHVNPKTRKTICRTFDIKDPKSMAKPADWKYQAGVCSSWVTLSCWLKVDLLVPLPNCRTSTDNMEKCLQEGLKMWAKQIESGICLIDGKKIPDDSEFTAGQKRNPRQNYTTQLLIKPSIQKSLEAVQPCGGSVSISGVIHSKVFLHSNKPKAKLAEKLIKRDMLSTVNTRIQMLLEELQTRDEERKGGTGDKQAEQLCLPRRIFCPVKMSGPLYVCDYQFTDEGLSEATDRLKEMLDIDAAEKDWDTMQEMTGEVMECETTEPIAEKVEVKPKVNNYFGVALAAVIGLLATAASMMYLNDV